jgi:hypothetical protein
LVLSRIIREEVVSSFGRRLKSESKEYLEAHRRYRLLDIDNALPQFQKPDIAKAMSRLRRKLMKPSDAITPLYVAETNGVSVDDVFMRGVRRVRPANDAGEELRDVVLWLWALSYSASAPENVAFISEDGGFWVDGQPNADIVRDLDAAKGRLSLYRSIDEFLKKYAPAPCPMGHDWFAKHFDKALIEREVLRASNTELSRSLSGTIRDVNLDEVNFVSGLLYEVAPSVQYAEFELSLSLSLTNIEPEQPSLFGFGGSVPSFPGILQNPAELIARRRLGVLSGAFVPPPMIPKEGSSLARKLFPKANAKFSARMKEGVAAEVSLDDLKIDKRDLYSQLYPETKIPDTPATKE